VFVDLAHLNHETKFSLLAPSLFRIWIPRNRIDIDINVKKSGNPLVQTYRPADQDESIVLDLEQGDEYTIGFHYITSLQATFCETFLLEIAIEPIGLFYQVPYCQESESKPQFSLSPLVQDFHLNKTSYRYFYTTETHVETILSTPIYSNAVRILTISIESNFLAGLYLQLVPNNTFEIERGEQKLN